jgi:hypothetical protein
MIQAVVPGIVLLGCSLSLFNAMRRGARAATVITGVWLAICMLGATHRDVNFLRTNLSRLRSADGNQSFAALCHPPAGMERARCLSLYPEEEQAILYVESHTLPADKIYVGAARHDKLFDNDIGFYFFSARGAATKWHDLHPGVETTAPIQREMIDDLRRNRAVYVVREPVTTEEPNGSGVSSGVMLLDNYIDANYRMDRTFGWIHVLRRVTPFAAQPSAMSGRK